MTLDEVRPGQRIRIRGIAASDVRSQALRLGLGVGAEATCRATLPRGPIVLGRANQEIAIGRPLAAAISVEVLDT
jgi:Fe2+ transport system protein FeoA